MYIVQEMCSFGWSLSRISFWYSLLLLWQQWIGTECFWGCKTNAGKAALRFPVVLLGYYGIKTNNGGTSRKGQG